MVREDDDFYRECQLKGKRKMGLYREGSRKRLEPMSATVGVLLDLDFVENTLTFH